jgi:hypothetical protein
MIQETRAVTMIDLHTITGAGEARTLSAAILIIASRVANMTRQRAFFTPQITPMLLAKHSLPETHGNQVSAHAFWLIFLGMPLN